MTTPLRSPDSNTQLIGQRVGEYRVLREVGRGGMGVVFEAVHNETGQQVAVKAIHESLLTNLSAVQRFVAEARLMGRVDHPGLTRVYDSGQLPGGRPYFVMEFLVGESLRERLRSKGRLGQKEAVAIGLSIAEALAAAHAAGIVHRDLKPDNLLLIDDASAPFGFRVKILDFGIAKAIAALAGETLPGVQTATGLLLGTPTYMAPEQCRGGVEVTDRADVYALGIVLYQLLSGAPPFVSRSPGDVIAMHIVEPVPPLSEKAPDVARPIIALVDTMLRKKAAERPTMAEEATRLDALRNLEPGTVILPPSQAAAKISDAMQAMPTTEMRANETRLFAERSTSPAPAVVQAPVPAKTERSSWLIVALLCAVILGGVTAALLLR
ncbi:MAG TPA: serine/threonine-protein kinase [Pseudomonadota bacterium]|nr:serine/threonine-protein kinase [Pseudomonadota bacterium]